VQTAVQQSSFQSSGFTKGMLIAESNACDICLPLNGEVFELKKLKPGENSPPLHPNCRCSIVPVMDDKAWEDSLIARGIKSRDQLKWEKQDLANRAKVAEGRKQAIKGNDPDKDEYLKYSNLVTDNRTASIAKFKNIKYNDPVEWQRLQDNFYVKQQLQAGAWQDKINDDSQDKHLSRDRKKNKNSNPGKKPKSIFNDNFDPYEIYDRIKGTGSILRLDNGQPTNKERVNLARDIGTLGADNNHAYGVTIHYGKTGAHLVPWKGRK
jgi:NAD+--asparagine ADP-ribosyltransferase